MMINDSELIVPLTAVWQGWDLTRDSVLYFWFGFVFCELIWVVVPVYYGRRAWSRIAKALPKAAKQS